MRYLFFVYLKLLFFLIVMIIFLCTLLTLYQKNTLGLCNNIVDLNANTSKQAVDYMPMQSGSGVLPSLHLADFCWLEIVWVIKRILWIHGYGETRAKHQNFIYWFHLTCFPVYFSILSNICQRHFLL